MGKKVRFMNSLSFCENKYYSNTANIQFSENCSQFPESTMLRQEKAADSTRINQPICLTFIRDFQPDAVDRL